MKNLVYLVIGLMIVCNITILTAVYFREPVDINYLIKRLEEQTETIRRRDAYIKYLEDGWNVEKQIASELWSVVPKEETDRILKIDEELYTELKNDHNFEDWME